MNAQSVDLSRRGGGVLLHVSSLPGRFGIGDLGPAAHRWIDLLCAAGQRWWQVLPLGYASPDGSPYRCFSAFASNPLLISPEQLAEEKLLTRSELVRNSLPPGPVNYARAGKSKFALLDLAHQRFQSDRHHRLTHAFEHFVEQEKIWLNDFSLFMSLCQADPSRHWKQWPKPLLHRQPAALKQARAQHANAIRFHQFLQFIFAEQLRALRDHAKKRGVGIVGDLPIFISPDSADVWTHSELFQLNKNLEPIAVAGVPPDMFSATGQRWGNPLYDWKAMARDDFAWWKARLAATFRHADVVRIDHFRGLESYWRIPAGCPTAQKGKWVKSPGIELFEALMEGNVRLPILAEDLGVITPAVEALRDQFHLPGMRVLQFGFGDESANPHAPHNYIHHCFGYTGTHDNDTVVGWYKSLSGQDRQRVLEYMPEIKSDPAGSMVRMLWASVAGQAIVPVQDLLKLGSKSRMNIPGRGDGNWKWRLPDLESCIKPLEHLARLTIIYGRQPAGVSA